MVMRISGISSGIETETIVNALVEVKRAPITALETKVTDDEDKLSQWSQLDTKLTDLRSATQQLTNYTTWRQMTATSSDTSKLKATVSSTSLDPNSYSINVTALARAQSGYSNEVSSTTADIMGTKTATYTINGATINIAANSSLTNIKDAINAQTSNMTSGVKASIVGKRLVLENTTTGTGHDMSISYTGGTLNILGPASGGGIGLIDASGALVNQTTSQNLAGTVNNTPVSSSSNTTTDLISGVSLAFTDTGTSTLTISRDTSTIKTLISDFITKYNDAMALAQVQGSVSLSSTGEVSTKGKLQGDYLLSMIQTNSRSILTSLETNPNYMDQDYNTLYKVGIWFSSEANELSITDEDKLDDALENHFDEVEKLFRGWGNTTTGQGQGVIRQLDDFIYAQIDPAQGNVTMKKNDLDADITAKNKEINTLTLRLLDYETSLWEHFAAMEEAVSAIQEQGKYVLAALGNSSS